LIYYIGTFLLGFTTLDLFVGESSHVAISVHDIRVPSVSHCPVEESFDTGFVPQFEIAGVSWRFQVPIDVALMRGSFDRPLCHVIKVIIVENDCVKVLYRDSRLV